MVPPVVGQLHEGVRVADLGGHRALLRICGVRHVELERHRHVAEQDAHLLRGAAYALQKDVGVPHVRVAAEPPGDRERPGHALHQVLRRHQPAGRAHLPPDAHDAVRSRLVAREVHRRRGRVVRRRHVVHGLVVAVPDARRRRLVR